MNKLIIVVAGAVVIAGGAVLAMTSGKSPNTSSSKTGTPNSASTTPANKPATAAQTNTQTTDTTSSAGTITYSDSGFNPETLTLKSGDKLTVKNTSSHPLQFDSNPHPQHTDDPEINIGIIAPGESQTITVGQTGSHGYHNHLSPGDVGILIVQ